VIRRLVMCSGCPFNSRRTGPPIPAEVWAAVMARIRGGEAWICHQTCDGPRVTPKSQLCAGAPGRSVMAAEEGRLRKERDQHLLACVDAGASLPERTRQLLDHFDEDGQEGGLPRDDAGYAVWFADLLDEWLDQRTR
jgi:hypothetical protein